MNFLLTSKLSAWCQEAPQYYTIQKYTIFLFISLLLLVLITEILFDLNACSQDLFQVLKIVWWEEILTS